MQYITVKGDIVEVSPFTIQLFHRVHCIWLKSQIKAMAFMTVFALPSKAIIRRWLLYRPQLLSSKLRCVCLYIHTYIHTYIAIYYR